MEGAAFAQVCHEYGVPFAAVRTVSDRADNEAHGDFLSFIHQVAIVRPSCACKNTGPMRMPGSLPAFHRRSLLLLLALAILAAHALGLVHGTLHGPGLASPVQVLQGPGAHEDGQEQGGLASLFDGHDGQAKCRLFDALTLGGPQPAATPPVPPPPLSAGLLVTRAGAALARWAALFEARGPPSFR